MPERSSETKIELVKAAEKLFSERGYGNTSVTDICTEVGVAHSLFYYYFNSKEDVIEAITDRLIEEIEDMLIEIADDPELKADKKFIKFMELGFERKKERPYLVSYFSREENPQIYHRLFTETVEITTPYLTKIVEQGVEEGVFETEYPEQTVRFWLNGRRFLAGGEELLDERIIEDMKSEAYMLERLLGAENDFLTAFYEEYDSEIKKFIEGAKEEE